MTSSSACGLDFGTSNSAIGVTGSAGAQLAEIENGSALMPSAVFFDFEHGRPLYGQEALDAYVGNTQGRLMRSLKSILGSSLIKESTQIRNARISFEAVILQFVREMKRRAEAAAGRALTQVVHGRPVHFVDGNPAADLLAESTLHAIAEDAGFTEISFAYEPIAAARAFELTLNSEKLALICDIGGGTSDLTVIRLGPERRGRTDRAQDILANFGVRLGGTDLDRHLSMDAAMPLLGLGSMLITKNLPTPRGLYADLAHWPLINQVYTAANRQAAHDMLSDAREPQKLRRLKTVLERHLGHRLALSVEAAKIVLSAENETGIAMDFIEDGLAAPATRDGFDDAVADERARLTAAVDETLKRAGLNGTALDVVFLTGGSARVPAIRKAIAASVSPEKFARGDDLLSVALGLTEEARLRYG